MPNKTIIVIKPKKVNRKAKLTVPTKYKSHLKVIPETLSEKIGKAIASELNKIKP